VIEIERKFLVANDQWRASAHPGLLYRQGYLARTSLATVRVRCIQNEACLTVKGPRRGLERDELTYPIPLAEAEDLLRRFCDGGVVEKVRHEVEHQGSAWVVDVFLGPAEGLVVAEIELERADQAFAVPPWLGAEVSHDPRYRNSSIALWKTEGEVTEARSWAAPPGAAPRRARSRRLATLLDAGSSETQPAT